MITILFACPLLVEAQPVLTAANCVGVPNESFTYMSATYQPVGAGGSNVTWDFSSLQPQDMTLLSFDSPSAGSQAAQFPEATLLRRISTGQENYFVHSNDSLAVSGVLTTTGHVVDYSDAQVMLRFPFSFDSTFIDSFRADYISGISGTRTGVDTVVADGFGTLKLPGGLFNNVLRVKVISHYNDTISQQPVLTFNDERYFFYQPGTHSYLMNINNTVVTAGSTVVSTVQTLNYLNFSMDIEDQKATAATLTIYPSPARGGASISFPAVSAAGAGLTVINAAGAIVKQVPVTRGDSEVHLDCSELPAGLYLVLLQDGEHRLTGRLMVR
jgi:hypothetical protein